MFIFATVAVAIRHCGFYTDHMPNSVNKTVSLTKSTFKRYIICQLVNFVGILMFFNTVSLIRLRFFTYFYFISIVLYFCVGCELTLLFKMGIDITTI